MQILLQITSARGPAECCQVVALLAEELIADALHLVNSDHRLSGQIPFLTLQFERFLQKQGRKRYGLET